jgi:hypothetical protein
MDKWLFLIVILCFLFVLTYDPKSGNLDKYIRKKENFTEQPVKTCCNNVNYMANNITQCRPAHFQAVQFGDLNYGCPEKLPKTYLGAIL